MPEVGHAFHITHAMDKVLNRSLPSQWTPRLHFEYGILLPEKGVIVRSDHDPPFAMAPAAYILQITQRQRHKATSISHRLNG